MIGRWWKIEGELLGDNELEERDRFLHRLPVNIVLLVYFHPFLDEKVRRIDLSCCLTSQSLRREPEGLDHVGAAQDHILRGELQTSAAAIGIRQHESQQ